MSQPSVRASAALGAKVVAIDVDPERLTAIAGYGADVVLEPREFKNSSPRKEMRRIAGELGAPDTEWRIFETSGSAAGQDTAFSLLTYGAHLSVVGYTTHEVILRLSNLMAFDATLQGNWGCLPEHFPHVLDLVLSGAIQLEPFIETRPMSQINEVLTALHEGTLKTRPVLLPDFE